MTRNKGFASEIGNIAGKRYIAAETTTAAI